MENLIAALSIVISLTALAITAGASWGPKDGMTKAERIYNRKPRTPEQERALNTWVQMHAD